MIKIAYIDPGPPNAESLALKDELNKRKRNDIQLDLVFLDRGPEHLEYRYYESLVIADLLHKLKEMEYNGYDASIIGCFYDPGLQEAREILNGMAVTAPGEASFKIVTSLGNTFSIIVGRPKWIPRVKENLLHYGVMDKLSSFKVLGFGVLDFHKDEAYTLKLMQEKCREAVERDYAETIILGCTMQFGFYEQIQKSIGVPVIDPLIASLKYAELLAELKVDMNWLPPRILGYEPPPLKEINDWGIIEQYGLKNIW